MKYAAIVLAAGKGERTGLAMNKAFYELEPGRTVLQMACEPFVSDPDCRQLIVTAAPHEMETVRSLVPEALVTAGGKTRQESVANALEAATEAHVLIHDGARPYVNREKIEALKEALECHDAALLMVPVTDTIKEVENGTVIRTLPRPKLWAAQTPQAFATDLVRQCHARAQEDGREATDDAQLVEWYSSTPVAVVQSDASNKKITVPEDL